MSEKTYRDAIREALREEMLRDELVLIMGEEVGAWDQIVNNAAKIHFRFGGQARVPLVIRAPTGWGQLAATHSQSLEAWFAHLPGLLVGVPAPPDAATGLRRAALR